MSAASVPMLFVLVDDKVTFVLYQIIIFQLTFMQSQQWWQVYNKELFNQARWSDGLFLLILVEAELIEKQ